jgi:hypothetical protein
MMNLNGPAVHRRGFLGAYNIAADIRSTVKTQLDAYPTYRVALSRRILPPGKLPSMVDHNLDVESAIAVYAWQRQRKSIGI